ncbi:hypothetical protein AAVH_25100 [Aphelenchoides avenae]|nr:hypothetical protein AAVH_25100 [Aphelenchus avenae]
MRATRLKSVSTTEWYNGNKPCLKNETKVFVPLVEEILVVQNVSYGEPPQYFNLTLDTTDSFTTLFSTKAGSRRDANGIEICYDRNATRHWFKSW